jgi:hypothetical protein
MRTARALGLDGPVFVGGSTALAHAGWTTQSNRLPELICAADPGLTAPDLRFRPRSKQVLTILSSWLCDIAFGDCPVLRPEMALADAVLDRLRGGATHIYDPDDLDPDEIDGRAGELFRAALDALHADPEEKATAIRLYGAVLDEQDDTLHFGR